MKNKRLICFLISFVLLLLSYAHASDKTEDIRIILSDSEEGISISMPLFSGQSYTMPGLNGVSLRDIILLLRPDTFYELTDCYRNALTDMYREKAGVIHKGIYAGDLFENASEEQIVEADGKDAGHLLTELLFRIISYAEKALPDDMDNGHLESLLSRIEGQEFGEETKVSIRAYDNAAYQTINIFYHNQCVLTISSDLTEKDECRFVIGRGAGAADYYEEISCRRNDDDAAEYEIGLYRTSAPAFRMAGKQECVLTVKLQCQNTDDNRIEFNGEARSVLLPYSARIQGYGSFHDEGQQSISADLIFDEQAENTAEFLLTVFNTLLQQ